MRNLRLYSQCVLESSYVSRYGDAKYADVLERALYNGVISGVSLSGDKFFYDNPLESMGQHERQHWFGCACCPGNITRFMASVPYYMYATQGNDVYVNLFIQSKADIETESNKINVEQTTGYPWDGKISIAVTPEKRTGVCFACAYPRMGARRPVPTDLYSFTDKAQAYSISVNGSKVNAKQYDGYATLVRNWKAGDVVEINLPMEVRRVKANDQVEDDRGKLAIEQGPIIFCLEGQDQADSTVFNKFIPDGTPMEASYDAGLLNGVMVLSGTAKEIDRNGKIKRCSLQSNSLFYMEQPRCRPDGCMDSPKRPSMPAPLRKLLLPAKHVL